MGGRIDLIVTLLAFLSAGCLLACSDRQSSSSDEPLDGPFESPYSGPELAERMQAAIDKMGAYTIAAQQTNFVLPQWGGSDGGSVTVGRRNGKVIALAELQRTGDGAYTVWLVDNQTYFQRSTCNDPARIPGGGADVLSPFVFVGNDRIKNARNPKSANGRTTLIATLDGLGEVEVSFDPATFLPNQLSARNATNNGRPLVWTFGSWQQQPDLGAGASGLASAPDRGPGGNPC